jgi:multiple sugar transport system substrate-binding protein
MKTNRKISRRDFLKLSAVAGSAGLLAACAPKAVETATTVATKAPVATAAPAVATEAPTVAPAVLSVAPGTTLTMKLRAAFMPQGNDVLKAMIQDWGKKNNIPVAVDIVSMNDLQTIAATAAETGAGPDIIEINQGSAHLFADKLANVSDVCEDLASRYGGYYTAAEEACKVEGNWLSVPRFFAPHAINYRKDLFEKVGITTPPTTWEELLKVGQALVDAGLPPIAFPLGHAVGDGNDFNYSVLWSHGASDVAKDGKTVTIDSVETRAALDYMKRLFAVMPPDTLSYDDSSNNRAMLAGTISATNNAATIYGTARNQATVIPGSKPAVQMYTVINHFPYPEGPKGRLTYAEFMSSAIFAYSPNVAAAKALLTYLNEEAQLAPWVAPNLSFVFPPLKAFKDNILMPWNTDPKLAAFKDYADTSHLPGYPSSNFKGGTEAYAKWLVVDMFASVCAGTATIEKAIANAKAELQKIYSK